jgi:hypothetical protein
MTVGTLICNERGGQCGDGPRGRRAAVQIPARQGKAFFVCTTSRSTVELKLSRIQWVSGVKRPDRAAN